MQDNKQAPGVPFAKSSSHVSSTSNIIPLPARKKGKRGHWDHGQKQSWREGRPAAGMLPGSGDRQRGPGDWLFTDRP